MKPISIQFSVADSYFSATLFYIYIIDTPRLNPFRNIKGIFLTVNNSFNQKKKGYE